MSFSRRSCRPRDGTQVSRIVGRHFTSEPPGKSGQLALFKRRECDGHTVLQDRCAVVRSSQAGFLPWVVREALFHVSLSAQSWWCWSLVGFGLEMHTFHLWVSASIVTAVFPLNLCRLHSDLIPSPKPTSIDLFSLPPISPPSSSFSFFLLLLPM